MILTLNPDLALAPKGIRADEITITIKSKSKSKSKKAIRQESGLIQWQCLNGERAGVRGEYVQLRP